MELRIIENRKMAWITVMLTLVGLLFSSVAQANQFKRIRDVNVSCNNALLCDLYITNPRVTLYSFGFRRSAAPDAPVNLVLATRDPLRSGSEIVFAVDGEEIFSRSIDTFNYRAAVYEYSYREQADVALLLAAARQGSELQITHVTRSGQSTVPFSLSGMIAGSIFMDEAQGRVGRPDAMLKVGERAAADPGAGGEGSGEMQPINGIDDLPDMVRHEFMEPAGRCYNPIFSPDEVRLGGFLVKLSEESQLLGTVCGAGGAYNQIFAFWEISGTFFKPLALPSISDGAPVALMDVFNAGYDPAKRELVSFYKGRGLGDCGTYHRWSITNFEAGNLFRLEEMLNKDDCDGIYKEDLSDYERLWPQP